MSRIKVKVPKKDLESFCLDDVLKQVKQRKKIEKEKALNKSKKKKNK